MSAEQRAKIAAAHLGKPKPRPSLPCYEIIDRGFGECWIVRVKPIKLKWVRELWASDVGDRGDGIYMHTCEIRGEENRCANPAHVIIGTKSANMHHALDLKAAAGEPRRYGGPQKGQRTR